MTAELVTVADAVVAAINGNKANFVRKEDACRRWLAQEDLEQLDTLRMDVVPIAYVRTRLTRGAHQRDCRVQIVVQKRLADPLGSTDEVDELVQFVADELRPFLETTDVGGFRLIDGPEAGIEDLYDPSSLREEHVFRSASEYTFRATT